MSYSIAPDRSFLQMLQQQMPSLKTLSMNGADFDRLIDGIFQVLSHYEIKVTIWVKLPLSSSGAAKINVYNQSGGVDRLYHCQTVNPPAASPLVSPFRLGGKAIAPKGVPLLLEANSHLNHEYFVIVLSSQVSFLLLAQQPTEQASENRSKVGTDPLPMKVVYNFSPHLIEALLELIKQSLVLTDSTPEALLSDAELSFSLPSSVDVNLISDLLQIPWQSRPRDPFPPPLSSVEVPPPSGISLTPEFLKQLTRELSLPLTNIKTALRLLESMQHKREQRQRYLTLLQRECDRQNCLLSSLQELVELNQKGEDRDRSPNLEDLVPSIVSTYQPLATEKGINLGYTITAGLPPVACPSLWLRQILRHLLQNSLKFTCAQGRIYVQVDHQQDRIRLTVTDTGVGIENKDIPHLFEPFFRGSNLPAGEIEGSGLGLMVVKQLIDRCQGTIKINSQPHKGTRILMTFPIVNG